MAPPGEDATLRYVNNDSQITLFFRHSGITETFDVPTGATPVLARLASISDRNGNTITYSYNSSGQLTAIIDSYGNAPGGTPSAHTTTIQYSSAGYVSQITDPTGRTYKYLQNASGQLTQYTDPAGNATDYAYDSYGNLTQITTPQGNITHIAYDAGNTNRVTSLTRLAAPSDTTGPTTSYQFATASGTCPANDGWTQGTVSDPDQHVATYCSDDLGRIRSVIDANGHARSTAYTADGFISSLSTPLGVPTTFAYSTDGNDNVTQIQQGASGGPQLTSTYAYTDATNPYQASTATDPQNHAFGFTYNTAGNLTKSQAQTTGDPTSGDNVQMTHNPDGTVATSTDPDGNQTTYHYTNGNLTEIVPPSGSGLNSIALTYDSADRVIEISTISGSTGHEVEYSSTRWITSPRPSIRTRPAAPWRRSATSMTRTAT